MRIPYSEAIMPTTQKRTLYIGNLNNNPVTLDLEIEHKGPEYTTTKELITHKTINMESVTEYDRVSICGSTVRSGGQMQKTIRENLDQMKLTIPRGDLERILDLWDMFHLNDLQPACIHQQKNWDTTKEVTITNYSIDWDTAYNLKRQVDKDAKNNGFSIDADTLIGLKHAKQYSTAAALLYPLKELGIEPFKQVAIDPREFHFKTRGLRAFRSENWDQIKNKITVHKETKRVGWLSPSDHPDGILGKACEVCRYKYGTAWLVTHVPENIKAELLSLFSAPTPEPETQLQAFIKAHKIGFTCQSIKERPDRHDFKDAGARHFKCRISKGRRGFNFYFSQGSAHTQEPTITDVLGCLSGDFNGIDQTFEDWASGLGYDADSRKHLAIYSTIKRQAAQLERAFGADVYQLFLALECD